MRIDLKVTGLDAARAYIRNADRQIAFAAAKALTQTGHDVRRAIPAGLQAQLDRPTRFTASETATTVTPARKDNLRAIVAFKPIQAGYLHWQVEGGTRRPERKALRLPSAIGLDAYGNLPRGIIQQLIAVARKESKLAKRKARRVRISNKVEIFYGDPTDVGVKNSPPGIYKIVQHGAKGGGSRLIPLIVFPQTTATYRPRLNLERIARPVVERAFPGRFAVALQQAMATAK